MVMIKRRTCAAPVKPSYPSGPYGSSMALPFGDGLDSPKAARVSKFGSTATKLSQSSASLPPWTIKALTVVVLFLLGISIYWDSQTRTSLKALDLEHTLESQHVAEATQTLNDARESQKMEERRLAELEHTKEVLEHEIRIADELTEAGNYHITNHIERRQQVLQEKIDSLRAYIQEESRREVLEKFGPGPHRVKMTVALAPDNIKTIVLEMASLEHMPHSVHVFLEMVSHRLWDNTVFWHHYESTHVLSASPIAMETGESRHHHFENFRLGGVSYAEHSPQVQHTKYTVGFAGLGPEFYINTFDNTKSHAPGGQSHYELDDEADPCFAKVVEGFEVVNALQQKTILMTKKSSSKQQVWSDYTLTKIMKVEILRED